MKKRLFSLFLAALVFCAAPAAACGTEIENTADVGDGVVITQEDKPYLALGADLSADEQHTVLDLMGIRAEDFDLYDVAYVNNSEEHTYLDAYVPKEKIGTRALSSVFICLEEEGAGVSISTYNINYCTVGMYKNALATAGIVDASIIVAGPFPISGTAALVGTFKAYEELTGESLDEAVVDAAMDELVTTGELEESIGGEAEDVEAMIADLKGRIARGELKGTEDIRAAIEDAAKNYHIEITEADKEKLLELLEKLKDLDLDWDKIADQASKLVDQLNNAVKNNEGFFENIKNFFRKLFDTVRSWFS
ncbi:MAG: DUF1002 domain-containing protein [Muribaculaceae bacterium]|nr:DUF1002 domain-containing protein [Roseburia sp.]MCM1431777.1 DUF1002 domain-containing protein [Muribaculaceae bacterium]MCM1493357.1 DUF1002 domain-containing protein [Muribaculaceae bacterium]